MKRIVAFDFDGTLTTRDTLLEVIRYAHGTIGLWLGLLSQLHWLLLMKLRLYPNGKTKERVFTHFFRGMPLEQFDRLCRDFAASHRHLLRPKAVEAIHRAQAESDQVLIVSASIDNWVQPFFPDVTILGTRIESIDGIVTGHFLTPNCYGQEKVRRILEVAPQRESYHLAAYGDSRGDREMLRFADESYYKPFRT